MAVTFNKAPSASKTPGLPNPFDKLSDTAKSVSAATRRMNDAVEHLNEALKKLNLGVTVWIATWHGPDIPGNVEETEEIGYARVKGKWGICLRRTVEHAGPDPDVMEWHFADSPRDLRLRNVSFLPKIVPALQAEAEKTVVELDDHASAAEKLAESILSVATKSRVPVSLNPKSMQAEVSK